MAPRGEPPGLPAAGAARRGRRGRHGGGDGMAPPGRLLNHRGAGETHSAWNLPYLHGPDPLTLASQDFGDGEGLPPKHRAKTIGDDLSPQPAWTPLPSRTAQLLLVVEDIDAPIAK